MTADRDQTYENVLVEVAASVAWVTLNRPTKRNAISPALSSEMLLRDQRAISEGYAANVSPTVLDIADREPTSSLSLWYRTLRRGSRLARQKGLGEPNLIRKARRRWLSPQRRNRPPPKVLPGLRQVEPVPCNPSPCEGAE